MFASSLFRLAAVCVAVSAFAVNAFALDAKHLKRNESETAIPGLSYGSTEDLPLPKTIFFGAGIDNILADAEEWKRRGVGAFFVDYVAREWSTDIWATDGKPWTIGESDETFRKAREAAALCKEIGSETFLKIAFDHTFEWYNDTAWQKADHNFRQFAIFARDAGFDGIALDIEYVNRQYVYDWEGYDYDDYTRKDLVNKIEERMTRVLLILYEEFPDMVFLTFPEQGLGLGGHIHKAWIEEAALRDAPGGVHYCTEYTYRHSNIRYMFGHIWGCNELFRRILSDRAWKYWLERCSVASGIWPFSSDDYRVYGPGIPFAELKQGLAASLMTSPKYNWIYGSYTQEQLIGRGLDKYEGPEDIHAHLAALSARETVVDEKWVRLARELRSGVLRDYSEDLGVLPLPLLVGPGDEFKVELAPTTPSLSNTKSPRYEEAWDLGLRVFEGEEIDLKKQLETITDWKTIGPFANDSEFSGHHAVFPPETEIDFSAGYEGLGGKTVGWKDLHQEGSLTSVDFKKVFEPTENVCAYAACTVTAAEEMRVHLRIGTNDSGKMWANGELVFDHPHDGRAILDRSVIPFTLRKGANRILVKVCNAALDWGFAFRITDEEGRPAKGLAFGLD